jgi:hypothetical protein
MLIDGKWVADETKSERRRHEEKRWYLDELQRLSRQAESNPGDERRKLAAQDRARAEWVVELKDRYI